jgi:hypothetical protein
MKIRPKVWLTAAGVVCLSAFAARLDAQISYPSFQVPYIAEREFNFALADAGRTTSIVFQWREGVGVRSQLSFDAGIADRDGPPGSDAYLLLGGQYAYQIMTSTTDVPFDMLFTAGVFTRLGDDPGNGMSVPFGVSMGHRFLLEGALAITPYVHPRLSIDAFGSESDVSINFDLGASFDVTNQLGFRFSATLGDADGFGFSVAWRPLGLRR